MRVLIVTEAIGKNFYGVEQVIVDLVKRLILFGFQFRILVSNIGDVSEITADVERIPSDAVENRFRWHPGMRDFFIQEIAEFHPDIVHVHGVFTFVQRTAVEVARAMNIPTLWSTHGGLEAWVWRQNSLFHRLGRRLYWRFVLSPSYKKVNAVHVITDLESRTLAGYFPNLPQVEIPNGIDLSIIPYIPAQLPEKKFVFLGRLHPVKGVDLLLKAFSRICLDDWQLIIAGPESDPEYTRQLRQCAITLGQRVQFVGPIYGQEKFLLLQKAWAVVVPSLSEVIALVNLEASAVFTPTITTFATGLSDWARGGGVLVDANEAQLGGALSEVAAWSLNERLKRGEAARQFVKERYNWDVIVQKWLQTYQEIGDPKSR